jgi:hypothetical protein
VADYPTLNDWLRNAKPGSPWLPFFHGTAQDPGICGTLETILRRLEATNPSGLGSLKKRFGDDDEGNVFGLRTELLIGFQLAEAGIPFRFGGRAEPDVKCELTPEIWIEARTRSRDDVLLLQRDLRVALGNSPVNAILSFERRLAVSEGERNAIIRRVLEAVESRGTAHSISVLLPEIEGTCGIESSPFGTPSVFLGAVTSNLGVHMGEVERELHNVIAEKTDQSVRNAWSKDTLLVVDASRLGMAWLRPEEVWQGRLQQLSLDWGTRPFLGVVVVFAGLVSTSMRTTGVVRDGLPPQTMSCLSKVLYVLGCQVPTVRR